MPRAKRTDRAEARRRHRAQLATDPVDGVEDGESTSAADGTARGRAVGRPARSSAQAPAQPQGSGIGYAFRAAFRPANLREDLAYLPTLLRSRAVLLPLLAIAATAIAFIASRGTDIVSALLAQYFLFPPPIGAIFIAGFFAPRASYIAGGIVGVAAAIGLTVAALTIPPGSLGTAGAPGAAATAAPSAVVSPAPSGSAAPSPSAAASASTAASASASGSPSSSAAASSSPAGSGAPSPAASAGPSPTPAAPEASPAQVATYSFLVSPLTGIFFAAAAAWYRRFLRLASPARSAQRGAGNRGRQQQRRR